MANSQANFETFQAWSAAKTREEFLSIVYRGALNRKEIALQCGFAKSVLSQNPRIHKLLQELETRLRVEGILPPIEIPQNKSLSQGRHELVGVQDENAELNLPTYEQPCQPGTTQRSSLYGQPEPAPTNQQSTSRNLENLVRRLQSENASQRAEIQELRRQLSRLSAIENALAMTGRLPR